MAWTDYAQPIGALVGGLIGAGAAKNTSNTPYINYQTGLSTSAGGSSQWSGVPEYLLPYLTGEGGIYPETRRMYEQNIAQGYQGMTPEQQAINQQTIATLQDQYGTGRLGQEQGRAATFAERFGTDPNATTSPQAMAAMGRLDPTAALQRSLSGQVDTRGLDALQQAATNRAMIGYGDAVQDAGDMFAQRIAPQLRSGAVLSGQYGGSRQGIAEGVAAGDIQQQLLRNARDLGVAGMDVGTQLYGDAYRQAQQQQYGAGMGLGAQAQQQAQFGDQFGQQARAQNALLEQQGLQMGDQALQRYLGSQDLQYGALQRGVADRQAQQQFGWDQLQNYINTMQGAQTESRGGSTQVSQGQQWQPMAQTGKVGTMQGAAQGAALGQGLGALIS